MEKTLLNKEKLEIASILTKLILAATVLVGFLFYTIHYVSLGYFPSLSDTEFVNVLVIIASIGTCYIIYFVVFAILSGFILGSLKDTDKDLEEILLKKIFKNSKFKIFDNAVIIFLIPSLIIAFGFSVAILSENNSWLISSMILSFLYIFVMLFRLKQKFHSTHFSIAITYIVACSIIYLLIFVGNANNTTKELDIFDKLALISMASITLIAIAFINARIGKNKLNLRDFIGLPLIILALLILTGLWKNFLAIPFTTAGYGNYKANMYAIDEEYLKKIDFNVTSNANYFVLSSLGNEYFFSYTQKDSNVIKTKYISKDKVYMERLSN